MDSSLFRSKVYVVTGGAKGIGFAIASPLLSHGAHVHVLDIVERQPKALHVANGQGSMTYHVADVRDRARCHEVFKTVIQKHGKIDGVVNNAGICQLEGEAPTDDLYDECYDVNVRGTWISGTEGLMQMKKQGSGAVVNVGSTASETGVARLPLYASTKHAQLGITRSWAMDYAKYGIRVNMVAPGKTTMSSGNLAWTVLLG